MDSPQLAQLRALIDAITPGNHFYAKRLAASGVTAASVKSLDDFSARVGFTHKQELVLDQAAHPPFGTNLTFPLERYTRFCQTTGTTGRPLVVLDTAESWDWLLGNWAQIYRAAGVTPGERIYFAFSFGPFLGFWTAFEAAAKYGCLCIPGGGLSSASRLRAIIQHGASVLLCTPTYAQHLADTARAEGIDLRDSAVRKIIVAGEPGGSIPHVRERISAGWNGARVIDHYGMTEVGPVSFEDPQHDGAQRIIESSYFAEIIHPGDGRPVATGEVGELVLTPLGRTGTPLLRYRTGDLVKRLPSAEGFVLDGGIIGRADDMIVVRGVNIYPSAVDAIVRSVPEISEYRVNVFARGAMAEIELEIESPDDTSTTRLERAMGEAFSLRIPIRRVDHGTLPRFELKARRWVKHSTH